MYNAMIAKTNL